MDGAREGVDVMRILGAPLRGMLVPMGASVASVLALTWYGMFWIPAQQHYLDESNLRLLRTMSAQIKARVDNFDQAIDHAIDSFPNKSDDSTTLHDYVQTIAPALEILRKPGKPDQNAYIERFNRSYRTEVLNAHLFESIADLKALTNAWLHVYNRERPHDSLGRVPPLTFLPRPSSAAQSPFELSA
jgi:transposase InsO family protein